MGGNLAKTSREQRRALFQSSKRNADSSGSLNRCAIQYEVSVCASHLPKHSHLVSATVDETFKLSDPLSVRNERNPYSAIAPLFCPRKTLSFKALRGVWGALSRKRPPRVPLVPASPARTPSLSEVAADNGLGGSGGVVAVGSVFDNADNSYLRIDEGRIASEERI